VKSTAQSGLTPLRRAPAAQRPTRLRPLFRPPKSARRAGPEATFPRREQNQKQRTNEVLPKPDKLIRYRQPLAFFFFCATEARRLPARNIFVD
jgi:hypothetical protein